MGPTLDFWLCHLTTAVGHSASSFGPLSLFFYQSNVDDGHT